MSTAHRKRRSLSWATLVLWGLGTASALAQTEAESLSTSFRKAAQRVLPAVVTVRTVGGLQQWEPLPGGPPFGFGNRRFREELGPPGQPPEQGGSGVVINAEKGLILTNDHVVQGAARVVVVLHDGRERPVTQIRRDPKSDLALLSVDGKGLTQAEWGDSDPLEIGDWVLAIGQPFGLSGTVTAGIISSKGRGIGMAMYEDLVQTDAAINPGNSGGPLVNLKGEVVGINTAMKTVRGGYDGIGFAIPSARARRVVADLAESGRVRRSYLGVNVSPLDRETRDRIDQPGAVRVTGVSPNSPASEAGLREGDLLLQFNGKPIDGPSSLQNAVEVVPEGQTMTLTIDRAGERREIKAVAKSQPETFGLPNNNDFLNFPRNVPQVFPDAPRVAPPRPPEPPLVPEDAGGPSDSSSRAAELRTTDLWFPDLGLRLSEPSPALTRRFRLNRSTLGLVIVGVDPDSPAADAHLKIGMVLTDVNQRQVETLNDFREALAKSPAGRDLVVRVRRGNRSEFLTIPKGKNKETQEEETAPEDRSGKGEEPPAFPDQD